MQYLLYAFLGAIFTSLTTILSKIGIKDVKSNFATFFRTGIVIICCIVMCLITGEFKALPSFTLQNYLFLGLSSIATGCSWLCYYKAIKLGNVNKVAPIDKSSFILTSILFVIFFFEDTTNNGNVLTIIMLIISSILMLCGTLLMIQKSAQEKNIEGRKWLLYAILSSVFASFVSFFIKLGLNDIPTSVGTLYRVIIVFIFSGVIVFLRKDYRDSKKISIKSWLFLFFSAIATGVAWFFEYKALNTPSSNPIVVSSVGKLSIILTMMFSFLILKERFSKKSLLGLSLLIGGIILIIIFGL